VNDESLPMDDNGCGTHVAGTIAAEDGVFGVAGVVPGGYPIMGGPSLIAPSVDNLASPIGEGVAG